jgi:uncharacterized integral membrane protein
MKIIISILVIIFVVIACTKEKTNYECWKGVQVEYVGTQEMAGASM